MRDIFSKVMTGSMIAGAALLVAACGGGSSETNNTAGELNSLGGDLNTTLPADPSLGMDNGAGMNGTTDLNGAGTTDMNAAGGTDMNAAGTTGGNATGGNTAGM